MEKLMKLIRYIWRSTAALLAVVLIITAFVLGWLIRGGGQEGEATGETRQTSAGQEEEDEGKPSVYYCSMHPQERSTDPNAKCRICFMDLVPLPEGMGDAGERELVMSSAAMKLAEIRTEPVARMFPTRTVRLFGSVDYDETRAATIAAYFPGRLERLFVDYTGIPVQAGDHLAEIYSPDLLTTQAELRENLAAVEEMRNESELLLSTTRARLEAAREKLRLWGLTDEQIRGLETSEEPMERLTIYSPIGGVVTHRMATEGMYVKTGDVLFQVADLSHLWVKLEAYESQLPWIRYGQTVTFRTDSLPGEVFEGLVSFIDPAVDPMTRTVRVRINVDNTDRRLKPGMFVRAEVRSKVAGAGLVMGDQLAGKWICPMHPEVIKDGQGECDLCEMPLVQAEELGYVVENPEVEPPLVIPASAPLITGSRAVVYVRVPDRDRPTFEGREVVLGPRAGDLYIVNQGLREGEQVVVNGAFKIDSALQIVAKPSMMSVPEEGASTTRFEVPEEFLFGLKPVYSAYFGAQESLAGDDLPAFRQAAADLHDAVGYVETTGVTGEPLAYWRRLSARLLTNSEHIGHLTDIDAARSLFETYSTAIIELEERFGHLGSREHYVTFCPMAFDNRGASWLAREEQISNPYFGASMLRCGEVRARVKPRNDPGREGGGQ
ncbi:MAG: efflux RND transporter periplasmic adaptor subunit [Phycisphaerales bacterium]|nr:MAG: efflux RND transporter periplasmic adaptor subunit [Phycisphaerales bacterium]